MTGRNKKKFKDINWEAVGVSLHGIASGIPADGPENHIVRTVLFALSESVARGIFPYTKTDGTPTGWEEYLGPADVE